uniref:Microsomal glutathione S-transferase 1 n=1 Tax=Geotrypetes seraphini TaxID=260995 RepID=A0A6P8RMU1_GEOSA|nr:microsomal glutathione S-transferase 1 isoform X2 [Geotrypetes seraphini]XP_033806649.1 microsomal glutathione S-transferase 1 isoform X2 [Geotrypetes seraphini]XP_033806650.1 microsomal glutathione S-transferase 1 isoform X2 [Geotrypetes seraphini]
MAELTKLMENEVFLAYVTHSTIVLVKMMLMSLVTAYFRITRKAFANPEDAVHNIKDESVKKFVRFDDDVERVRRCHHNDLENIVPFVGIGLLYALSSPDLFMALIHFRIFTASRIYHTISYLIPLPQPNRGLGWMIGYGVTFSMAYTVLKTTLYL